MSLPPLQSGRTSVRSYRGIDDAEELVLALDDPRVWVHIPAARPTTARHMDAVLNIAGRQTFVIRVDDDVVGTTSLLDRTGEDTSIEIGATLLSPAVWGTGLNRVVKDLLLGALFDADVEWVLLRTDERNERSARAILKLPGVTELEPRVEADVVRRDGTRRTSRMFRVDRSGAGSASARDSAQRRPRRR